MISPLADTVLAWLQNELHIYITLSLIQPLSDLTHVDDKVVVCLAHRYFCVPHLIQQLQQPDRDSLAKLFQEHAVIDIQKDDWLYELNVWAKGKQEENRQEGYMEFEKNANQLLSRLLDLYHSFIEEHSVASSKKEDSVDDIESIFQDIQTHELLDLESTAPSYVPVVSAIGAVRAVIEDHLQNGDRQATQIVAHVRNELEFIQAKMLKTTTTDAGIQDLEERAARAGELLETLPNLDEGLSKKYKSICAWVEEVRVWFVEADRIRKWIEERIVVLENQESIDALEEVELDYAREQVDRLNREHQRLKKEIEAFDEQDMARLRAHVKALTGSNKDLSPADTTTIEITFTTLMTLDRLMHLLRRRTYELQILTLRMDWEHEYDSAVGWVRLKLEQTKQFIHSDARWKPMVHVDKQKLIEMLVEFEKECSAFDKAQFTTTVNAYQELDDSCHMELPSHLESRQVALEESFETLTNRIALARQVVEQHLVITDSLERADELKTRGEALRQEISQAEQMQTGIDLNESVSLFQEDAMRLVTGLSTRIPYPEAAYLSDQQANEDANETIRMVIGARKSALMLLSEALDQSLSAYRRALQLQKRVKQLQEEINRLGCWVEERMRTMQKAKLDVFVGKCALDEVDLARLRKERDGQVAKLKGIRESDVRRLKDSVHSLPNITEQQKSCIIVLQSSLDDLEQQMSKLNEALSSHSLGLNILEKRIAWEAHYNKSFQWITKTTYDIWDFTSKKAQWRNNKDSTASEWEQTKNEFKEIEGKIDGFEQQSFDQTQKAFCILVEGFDLIEKEDVPLTGDNDTMTPEHVKRRQDTLKRNFSHLKDLLLFTQEVLNQHATLDTFSLQASVLYESGDRLLNDIQKHLDNANCEEVGFQQLSNEYAHQVLDLWTRMGSQIPYPQCNEEARATRFSTADDEIGAEIANSVYKTYADLQDLVNQIKELLLRFQKMVEFYNELNDCIKETEELTASMKQTKQEFKNLYTFELYEDTIEPATQPLNAQELEEKTQYLVKQRYEPLIKRTEALTNTGDEAVDLAGLSLSDLNAAHKDLVEYTSSFRHLVTCYNKRLHWQSLMTSAMDSLESLQERVRNTTNEKNYWLSLEQQDIPLEKIVKDILTCEEDSENFETTILTLDTAYDDMTIAYKALGEPPSNVDEKQIEIKKRLRRIKDSVKIQASEIKKIHARHVWENSADKELRTCSEFETEISNYTKKHARWSSEISIVKPPRDAFFANTKALKQLLKEFDTLEPTEFTLKRKTAIESSLSRLESSMRLLDQVLSQTEAIRSLINRIDGLENQAESLKTRFLATDEGEFEEEFDSYKKDVQELDITFPVLTEEQAYSDTISDMLKRRYTRLEELVGHLASILETKEQASRRRAAEASYLSEAETVREWIKSKWEVPDTQDLTETVETANATYASVLAYASSINSLRASSVKTAEIMEDDSLKSIQEELEKQYEALTNHVYQTKQDLTNKLRQAEWDKLLEHFEATYSCLKEEMQASVEDLTDQNISDWQGRVQSLELEQVDAIQARANMNQEAYAQVLDKMKELKLLVHNRSTEASQYKWKQRYLASLDKIENFVKSQSSGVAAFLNEQGKEVEKTKAAYKTLANSFESQTEFHDEICSSYCFLQSNNITEVDERQQTFDKSWIELQKDMILAKHVLDQATQWAVLFDKLDIKDSLSGAEKRLKESEVVAFDKERLLLNGMNDTIHSAYSAAQGLSLQAPEAAKIKENLDDFLSQYNPLSLRIQEVQEVLNEKEKKAQKDTDLEAYEVMSSAVKETIHDQIEQWIQELEKIQQQPVSATIKRSTMELKQNELLRHFKQVVQPILIRLKDLHQVDIDLIQEPLQKAFDTLSQTIKGEKTIRELIRKSFGQAKSAADILSWISHCQNAIEQIDLHDEAAQEDIESLQDKICGFTSVVASFENMTADIYSLSVSPKEQGAWDSLISLVDQRAREVKERWEQLEIAKNDAVKDIERTTRNLNMLRKIKNIMGVLGETRDCLDSIHIPLASEAKASQDDTLSSMLRQPEIESYLQTLTTTEEEMRNNLRKEMLELDNMVTECNKDDSLMHQYQETKDAVVRITDSLEEKKSELSRALELGILLTITDDLSILQSSLEEAMCKPASVTLIGHSMSRSDLQAKTIELDARYKYYENNILKALKAAKETPMTHQIEKQLAAQHIKSIEKRWDLLKKQYKSRKVELGRNIDTKEYQQKQTRDRKTSLPNRRPSPLLRVPDTSRLLPTPSASSSGSSRHLIGRHQQPSKSATHVKTLPRMTKPPLNSYVADPGNDLDIEIGRIVNNTPYRVKVKMVPGEVGRYWFGDRNPKMAYCRVLKSKMVMVRVGGGWTELSQFLRDHALLEGDFIPKLADTIPEEEPVIQEGFIETRRANPLNHSSALPTGTPSHSASTSGYKDGDKFITTDGKGNQLEVKMRRFAAGEGNDYTRRRMARKKEKPTKENSEKTNSLKL
ncbi:hypothetical protein BY458DRAFT_557192 [Sporodiniella umbellata]|nr:hypothetical protein BY458DRAFT_557192 [Sporodiniella umbellata]